MMALLKRLFHEESAQGMVEYGLIIALVAVALIAVIVGLRGGLRSIFERTQEALENPDTGGGG
ncbi:MAG: Flp family type IVb pilin [Bacillota bacterium]